MGEITEKQDSSGGNLPKRKANSYNENIIIVNL